MSEDKIIIPDGLAGMFKLDTTEDAVVNGVLCYHDGDKWRQYSAEAMATTWLAMNNYVELNNDITEHWKERAEAAEKKLENVKEAIR